MKKNYQIPEFQVIENDSKNARLFVASSGEEMQANAQSGAVTTYTTGVTTGWF